MQASRRVPTMAGAVMGGGGVGGVGAGSRPPLHPLVQPASRTDSVQYWCYSRAAAGGGIEGSRSAEPTLPLSATSRPLPPLPLPRPRRACGKRGGGALWTRRGGQGRAPFWREGGISAAWRPPRHPPMSLLCRGRVADALPGGDARRHHAPRHRWRGGNLAWGGRPRGKKTVGRLVVTQG